MKASEAFSFGTPPHDDGCVPVVLPRRVVPVALIWVLLGACLIVAAYAGDRRWNFITEALSQIESGCNPKMVGAKGEITEYQILPENWAAECRLARLRTDAHANRVVARLITWRLLSRRVNWFEEITGRTATAEEVYALWNAPGNLAGKSYDWRKLSPRVKERCRRFAALYEANQQRRHDETVEAPTRQRPGQSGSPDTLSKGRSSGLQPLQKT